MRGHNYGECRKCGEFHEHPRGTLGKHIWSNKQHPKGMSGKKHSKKAKDKIGKANLGERNGMWKGDNVKKLGLHLWVRRNKPKSFLCEECQKKEPYDLANISGKYKRDINDFEWLCRSCHMLKDGRMNNLRNFKG